MIIKLTSKTGVTFEIFKATDRYFLMTTPRSDLVFTLFHGCGSAPAADKYPLYEDGSPVHSLGVIGGAQIGKAWDNVMAGITCFSVKIVEYVGDMEFPTSSICCAPSLKALWQRLDEEMAKYRGDGEYMPDSDMWDYGETMAAVDDVHEVDRDAVKFALQHRLISLWLWVS